MRTIIASLLLLGLAATALSVAAEDRHHDHSARDGYNHHGYDRDGYNRRGYDHHGYDRGGYNERGYNRDGYDRDGYDSKGYNHAGYDRKNYKRENKYDHDGYDNKGYNHEGYDRNGYDYKGYDAAGYDSKGYTAKGYDVNGYDRNGYDRDGYDSNGYDHSGHPRDGRGGRPRWESNSLTTCVEHLLITQTNTIPVNGNITDGAAGIRATFSVLPLSPVSADCSFITAVANGTKIAITKAGTVVVNGQLESTNGGTVAGDLNYYFISNGRTAHPRVGLGHVLTAAGSSAIVPLNNAFNVGVMGGFIELMLLSARPGSVVSAGGGTSALVLTWHQPNAVQASVHPGLVIPARGGGRRDGIEEVELNVRTDDAGNFGTTNTADLQIEEDN